MKRLFLVLLGIMGHHALASQKTNVPLQATANQIRKHQYTTSEDLSNPVARDRVLPPAKFRDVPGLIMPTKDSAKVTWAESVKHCTDMEGQPWVPRSSQDFEVIRSLRYSLGGWNDGYLWLPASDITTEGELQWWDGEDASNSPGLQWMYNSMLYHNHNDRDCVFYGSTGYGGVHMWPCNRREYPMICQTDMVHFTTRPMFEITNQTTTFTTNSSTTSSRPNITTESIVSTSWPDYSTTVEPDRACGGEYNFSSGMIRHPLNGSHYHNNQKCIWIFRATDPINITFISFDTETRFDYLYIRDGESNASPLIGTFNGNITPIPVQTTTNSAYLYFTSDRSVTRTGFVIHWELSDIVHLTTRPMIETTDQTTTFATNSSTSSTRPNITTESTLSTSWPDYYTTVEPDKGCGGEYNSSSGMIRHPLNGSHYRINQNCTWFIRATDPINITFVSFDTETRYDYLSVRDGEGKALLVLGIFDGASIPSPLQTRTGVAQLQFISDSSVTQTGFELHWKPSVSEICPDGYVEIGTQCLIMTNIKVNWNQSKTTCGENSAQLVSLKEPTALRDYVKEHFPKSSFWVGGRYYRNQESWQWLSGAPFNSSFPWGINGSGGVQQTKGGKQDCMILRYFPIQDQQQYVENRCNKKNYFICEKPKVKRE